jgi:hypothetical protein
VVERDVSTKPTVGREGHCKDPADEQFSNEFRLAKIIKKKKKKKSLPNFAVILMLRAF